MEGQCFPYHSTMWPNVSALLSPNAAASEAAPIPKESIIKMMQRFMILTPFAAVPQVLA